MNSALICQVSYCLPKQG